MKHFTNTDNPIDFPTKAQDLDKFIDGYADFVENMTDEEWENLGKSMLKHAKGNVLDMGENGDFEVVIQGCNCFNAMGGGIAREIRERYPYVAEVDAETIKGDYNKLGTFTSAPAEANGEAKYIIINAYTQFGVSSGEDVFEYVAFELILQKMVRLYGTYKIGLPYIGMGLAGGDKETIMLMIEDFAQKVAKQGGSVTLVEFG